MNPPPFLVSFSTDDQFLKALPGDVRDKYGLDFKRLCDEKLPPVVSVRCLATLFGYSTKFMGALCNSSEKYYRTFKIPKGRKQRIIRAPRVALKVVQKWLAFHLAEKLTFHECVFGFIKGRSPIDAAALHCGADWVYSLDITDFFPSTPMAMVKAALEEIGYTAHGAEIVSKLSCYAGGLAQGAPTSPCLSNLVFRSADIELQAIATEKGLKYSRYADDIVFSGKGAFPEDVKSRIKAVIESRGWIIAVEKEFLAKRPNRLKVHGLLVHGEKPRLTKGYRNRIRAYKHLSAKGAIKAKDAARVAGHISYAQLIDRKTGI